MAPAFIVAEISKTWVDGKSPDDEVLCQKFERVIGVNFDRGYRLLDWRLSRVRLSDYELNETIIAVFEQLVA